MKKDKIIYWISTSLIFLWEGVIPGLTSHTDLAKQGISHLGYPDYFRVELAVFKVLGALALILPMVPARVKEWAYAGFAIVLISACVSHTAVDGLNGQAFFPLIILAILVVSYVYYHKIKKPVI